MTSILHHPSFSISLVFVFAHGHGVVVDASGHLARVHREAERELLEGRDEDLNFQTDSRGRIFQVIT